MIIHLLKPRRLYSPSTEIQRRAVETKRNVIRMSDYKAKRQELRQARYYAETLWPEGPEAA